MENVPFVIGCDLSKKSIDLACYATRNHLRIENSLTGYKHLINWLKQQRLKPTEVFLIMEHTGLYSYCFEKFLHAYRISFSKVSALEIKRSSGLTRGKSDRVDAYRIACYGAEKRAKIKTETKMNETLDRLKILRTSRVQLVRHRASLLCSVKELKNIGLPESDLAVKAQIQVIKTFSTQIEKLDAEIKALIEGDQQLLKNFKLLTTIKGIGRLTALAVLIKTGNFTRFSDGRKFACYCGTAPFEHTSGTSVRGRNRVSHLADKDMKCLLDLAAKTAVRHDKELRDYYERRVAEGKSKMSTLNIVRNKLINRMFAVVRRQEAYVEHYSKAA
jgi:transposase